MAAVLEGLLFLTGDDGLTLEQASDTLGTKEDMTEKLFQHLQEYYIDDHRGIEIARFGNTYKFLSKAFVHPYAQKLFQLSSQTKLSNAALETLAIIAYKQPITRVEIEEIRGVGADVMLRKLEARGLIKEDGRSEAPGRPILYSVTNEFMDAFSLLSLDELPDLPQFNQDEGEGETNLFAQ
ncbi:MAG: SMC-Scp complex subunit ScpB [Solobacterium sp.]|nr:SMC-Scp complex subunit ScpB [Solobacterium sp.]